MWGRGRWFGRGYGLGLGLGRGAFGWGWRGYGWPGNPYPYCRNFPWLPRGWWWSGAYGVTYPWARWPVYGQPAYYGAYLGYPYPVAYQTQQTKEEAT